MKTYLIAFILLIALAPVSGLATLGTTVDECNGRYGAPVGDPYPFDYGGQLRTRYEYHWRDLLVLAVFVRTDAGDDRCASIAYEKMAAATETGSNQKKMSAAEIENILALNANGSSWKRTDRGWIRTDKQGFVREFNFKIGRVGLPFIPANMLAVFDADFDPPLAASLTGVSPPP